MSDARGHQLGKGKLTAARVGRDALGMLRQSLWRVAGVALLLFAVPALVTALAVSFIESSGTVSGLGVPVALVALLVATLLRLFGPVVFAGFLDEAVGKEYLFGEHESFGDVVRKLPWLRLVLADIILGVGAAIGLALFVLPGILFYALFGLIGPVLVQERLALRPAFRRTYELSRTAVPLILVLVVVPVAFEQVLHELLLVTVHDAGLGIQVLAEWLVAVLIGATVGLIEVALAAELIARNPTSATGTAVSAEPI
jgi:hypothetical protein